MINNRQPFTTRCAVQMMSYRVGHHSTSDDSSRYRDAAEIAAWKAKDPVERLRAYLEGCGLWDSKQEAEIRGQKRTECATALKEAAAASKHPAPGAMFEDGVFLHPCITIDKPAS